ncbi:uncharacterized protein MYCFIDRAFT_180395 [Pseudocercospora fijiensis CIRAD86]|uniref:Uncharacterized protein n=1 Tax=Pseudocercospora fijiensis (strain CIRAD86) TaxID=383855 RepID=M2YGW7_PSEFD|nr:uncharacterized protein MYCFIDRAFT_180395 [Pseudocercospora fijiensis CIRAD86]EME77060.1 hypothetical protein MYCFIDRAFT_180395 [Pseudocercospora fijiensis CIRAD86]
MPQSGQNLHSRTYLGLIHHVRSSSIRGRPVRSINSILPYFDASVACLQLISMLIWTSHQLLELFRITFPSERAKDKQTSSGIALSDSKSTPAPEFQCVLASFDCVYTTSDTPAQAAEPMMCHSTAVMESRRGIAVAALELAYFARPRIWQEDKVPCEWYHDHLISRLLCPVVIDACMCCSALHFSSLSSLPLSRNVLALSITPSLRQFKQKKAKRKKAINLGLLLHIVSLGLCSGLQHLSAFFSKDDTNLKAAEKSIKLPESQHSTASIRCQCFEGANDMLKRHALLRRQCEVLNTRCPEGGSDRPIPKARNLSAESRATESRTLISIRRPIGFSYALRGRLKILSPRQDRAQPCIHTCMLRNSIMSLDGGFTTPICKNSEPQTSTSIPA